MAVASHVDAYPNRIPVRAYLLLALIVLLAGILRFIDLPDAPVGGHGDVAWVGLNALDWTDRGIWPFYVRELYAPEFPMVLLTGLLIPVAGISYMPGRLITATSGVLFVAFLFPATWWLTEGRSRIFRERASLLASLAGAVSLHAMYLSRLGMESPPLLMVITLLIWFTAWTWRRGGLWRWTLAGATLALAQYVYLPARLLPLVLILWLVHSWWADRERLRQQWRGWLMMAVVAFVLTLPAIILFITVPGSFSGRADTGTATTGGWAWNYDTSAEGGLPLLLLKKIGLTLLALGIYWNGPYTIMNQPMLAPLFFLGFLIAVGALLRYPRQIVYAWPALAIPVMLVADLISGSVAEAHALHQMGILPFVFILAGAGLAQGWEALDNWLRSPRLRSSVLAGGLALAIVPSLVGTYRYLHDVIPAQYADPENGWRTEQIDVDLSRHILEHPDRAYLLSYEEYSRSNISWLTAAVYRDRRSAIAADGMLQIPHPPVTVTVIMTDEPERPRHDGQPSHLDTRLWVLLYNGQTLLLPPLTTTQEQMLLDSVKTVNPERLIDRSDIEIARFFTLPTPINLFTPHPVIDSPLQATFNGEVQVKGYSIRDSDLTPGKLIFVTLYWQAIKQPGEDYQIFAQVWNDAKQSLAGAHDFPFGGAYRARIWRPDEIVATHHWLQLPNELPAGRYTLAVGLTHLIGDQRIDVTGPNSDPTLQVALAPNLRRPLPAAQPGTPPSQTIQFGDAFSVAGLDLAIEGKPVSIGADISALPGQTLATDITWRALARPPQDYSAFLHIATARDVPPLAQTDVTMGGSYPTGAWRSGDLVHDHMTLKLPADLPPGRYPILLGIYYWQTNERLALSVNGAKQTDPQLQVGTLVIGG